MRRSERAPGFGLGYPLFWGDPTYVQACLNPYRLRRPSCLLNVTTQALDSLAHPVVWWSQWEPPVGHTSGPAQSYVRPRAHPHRYGTLHRQGIDARLVDTMVLSLKADYLPAPQQANHLYLLLDPSAARAEVFAERLVLHSVPAYAYPKAKPSAAKNIDFGRLFGDERALPLGQDYDTTDELKTLGDGGQVAKEGQRLMEHGLVRISSPAFSVGRIGTEHVIVGEEVFVAEFLGGLNVVSDGFRVGTYLSLRESHTYLHTQPPSSNSSRIHTNEQFTQHESPRCARPLASLSSPLDVHAANTSICYRVI